MDALQALQQRVSCPRLTSPGPTPKQLEQLIRAAVRVPDHARLRPWRFLLIEGDSLDKFGELLVKAQLAQDPAASAAAMQKTRNKPLRAPAMIVAIASIKEHPKVPEIEQLISAGAAASNIVTAAFSLGLGAIWRTGTAAYQPIIKQGLGLVAGEHIIGFIYLGTPAAKLKPAPDLAIEDFYKSWS